MKIVSLKSDLLKCINTVSKAVPSRTTMPVLQCILINASSDTITLTANDMELGIETTCPGRILEKGMVAIDARLLSEIIRKLPENEVTIDSDARFSTLITCEKARFTIMGQDGTEFSMLPYIERDARVRISEFTLREVILQTIFSISSSESNKMMTGELFEISGDTLRVCSLDGHRISLRKIILDQEYPARKVIVPGKTLNEIARILSPETEKYVDIFFTDNHILFEFENTIVVSRLIEGNYFRVDQMLSNDYESRLTVNKKDFMDCLDRSTLLVKEGDKRPIILNIQDDFMELKIASAIGTMDETIDITLEGKTLLIGFNPRFLIDALRVIDEEEIDIYLMNPKAPCVIRDKEESYVYLILPVNFVQ